MKFCLLLLFVLFIYTLSSCTATHKLKDNLNSGLSFSKDSLLNQERLRLKKYALCKCLSYKYPLDSFLLKDGSMEGLVEVSSYGNHAYEVIDRFIQNKSSSTYKSKYTKKLYIMQCLDIYESAELALLIRKLDDETGVLQ